MSHHMRVCVCCTLYSDFYPPLYFVCNVSFRVLMLGPADLEYRANRVVVCGIRCIGYIKFVF